MQTDSVYIQQVQQSPAFDYPADIASVARDTGQGVDMRWTPDLSWMHILTEPPVSTIIAVAVLVALVLLLLWRLSKNIGGDDDDLPSGLGSDSIYGHDWSKEIADKVTGGDYDEVAVLCYLRWLDSLNADGVVKYHKSKTPGMYSSEVAAYCESNADTRALRDKTETLTKHYLDVRYGHRHIDEYTVRKLISL